MIRAHPIRRIVKAAQLDSFLRGLRLKMSRLHLMHQCALSGALGQIYGAPLPALLKCVSPQPTLVTSTELFYVGGQSNQVIPEACFQGIYQKVCT